MAFNMTQVAFSCKKCGICCKGAGGIVLSAKDLARLCDHLAMTESEFKDQYTYKSNGRCKLRQGKDGCCIFFQNDVGCEVHAAKPDVCKAWPFFRGNLEDEISLEMAKEYCPGISRNVSFSVFKKSGLDWLADNHLLNNAAEDIPNALINAHLQK